MHPDDRRDALIAVFVALAHRHGRAPTTSEIAIEAGVAEGTIFRVFATKEALENQAVQAAFCPAPVRRRIAAIDPDGSLRDRLVDFTRIMQTRFTEVFGLMAALGLSQPPNRGEHRACYEVGRHLRAHGTGTENVVGLEHDRLHQPLLASVHELLLRDEEQLVVPGPQVVHRIRLLTFSGSHPGISEGQVLTAEEIVDTVLFGVVRRDEPTGERGIRDLYCELTGGARLAPLAEHDPSGARADTAQTV